MAAAAAALLVLHSEHSENHEEGEKRPRKDGGGRGELQVPLLQLVILVIALTFMASFSTQAARPTCDWKKGGLPYIYIYIYYKGDGKSNNIYRIDA